MLVAFEKGDIIDSELYSLFLIIASSSARIFSYPQEIIESDEYEVVNGLLSLASIGFHCHLGKIFLDVGFDQKFLLRGWIILFPPV